MSSSSVQNFIGTADKMAKECGMTCARCGHDMLSHNIGIASFLKPSVNTTPMKGYEVSLEECLAKDGFV